MIFSLMYDVDRNSLKNKRTRATSTEASAAMHHPGQLYGFKSLNCTMMEVIAAGKRKVATNIIIIVYNHVHVYNIIRTGL